MEMRNTYIVVGKPGQKRPFGKGSCRWEDNTEMIFKGTVWTVFKGLR
jgi:hypothetical protein